MIKIKNINIVFLILLGSICLTSCSKVEKASEETVYVSEITSTTHETSEIITETSIIESSVIDTNENNLNTIKIAFGGDTFMDLAFGDAADSYGADFSWTDISPIFKQADIGFVNLETSVSLQGASQKPSGFGFRTNPDKLKGYVNAGITVVSGANNHVRDYGVEAFSDTIKYLNQEGIAHVGIGENFEGARKPVFIEQNGVKVGILGYSSIIPNNEWLATATSSGLAGITKDTIQDFLDDIKKYNDECDVLIISVHWGIEHTQSVTDYQKSLAKQMIDNGADMILGHHPHILQPIEFYKDKPIFYSLGNLIFLKQDDNAGKTAVFEVDFDKNGFVKGKMYPVFIQYCKANLLDESNEMKLEILANVAEISKPYGTGISKTGEISKTLFDDPPIYYPRELSSISE